MGCRVLDKPDQKVICDVSGDSKSLKGLAKYVNLILENFRARFKREYLTMLNEFHTVKKTLSNRIIGRGHIVTIYEEKNRVKCGDWGESLN